MLEDHTEAESTAPKPARPVLFSTPQGKGRLAISLLAGFLILLAGYSFWPPQSPAQPGNPSRVPATSPPSTPALVTGPEDTPTGTQNPGNEPPSAETAQPFTRSPYYASALSVAGMEEDGNRTEAIEALMETWVKANPWQAANWAGSLPAGAFRDDSLSALMVHWAASSPADAARWMTRSGVDDGEAASVLAASWAVRDPSEAAAWAATMGNLESRRYALGSVAAAWAATAPQAAAAFAEKLPANDRAAAITAVLSTWASSAPAEAAAWLANVPFDSPSDHALALATLVTPWSRQSPAAVSKYINALPEGPAREAAASQFAVSAAATAPAEALMWAMNLTDPDQRNQVVSDACESWYDGSPETFRSGIAEAIGLMDDPAMRRGVYEMLYERDPDFQTNLLRLVDQAPAEATRQPAIQAADPGPASAPESQFPDASLLLPDATVLEVQPLPGSPEAGMAPGPDPDPDPDPEAVLGLDR